MHHKILIPLTTAVLSLSLLSACSDEAADSPAAKATQPAAQEIDKKTTEKKAVTPAAKPDSGVVDVMDMPMNFSTPATTKKSFLAVKVEAGGMEVSKLLQALKYLQKTDKSVNHNKQKLYKKLNGKTPNEIMRLAGR